VSLPAPAPVVAAPAASRRGGRLLQVLGVAFGLAIIVGNSIGVGIFRTPGDIAAALPHTGWILGVWVLGGLYALLGALSLAELGAMIPTSGGQYVFARRALGEYAGFVVGWSDWLSASASVALIAIAFGEYTGELLPGLAPRAAGIACVVILGFTVVHWIGIRSSDAVQQATSVLKVLVLAALAAACWLAAPARDAGGAGLGALPAVGAVALALQGVIYTYDGWNGVLYFSGEVKDPGRDIPRSMAGGVVLVIVIYFAINLAYLHVLSPAQMAGNKLVAGAVAGAALGASGETIVRVVITVSLLSACSACLLIASRVPYAMSADRLLPAAVSRVNERGTPVGSLLLSSAVALALILSGTFNQVLALAAFFFVLNYTVSFTSLFVLRRREPATPRPYRAWGHPWSTGLLLLGSLGFLASQVAGDAPNSMRSLAILAVSYPAYRLVRAASRRAEAAADAAG